MAVITRHDLGATFMARVEQLNHNRPAKLEVVRLGAFREAQGLMPDDCVDMVQWMDEQEGDTMTAVDFVARLKWMKKKRWVTWNVMHPQAKKRAVHETKRMSPPAPAPCLALPLLVVCDVPCHAMPCHVPYAMP